MEGGETLYTHTTTTTKNARDLKKVHANEVTKINSLIVGYLILYWFIVSLFINVHTLIW